MTYVLIGIYVLGFGFVFRNRYKAYLTAAHERSYRLYKTIEHGSVKEAMAEKTALAIFMGFSWPVTFWLPLLKGTITTDVEKRIAVEKMEAELKELQRKIDADMKKLGLPATPSEIAEPSLLSLGTIPPNSVKSIEIDANEVEWKNGRKVIRQRGRFVAEHELDHLPDVRDIQGANWQYSTYKKYLAHPDIEDFLKNKWSRDE